MPTKKNNQTSKENKKTESPVEEKKYDENKDFFDVPTGSIYNNSYYEVASSGNSGFWGNAVALLIILAFVALVVVAAIAGGNPMVSSGNIDGANEVAYGQSNTLSYKLEDGYATEEDEIIWYVDGEEVQRKAYSDETAIKYDLPTKKVGAHKVRVEVGNKAFSEYDVNVSKPKLNVAVDNYSVIYGEPVNNLNYTANGFVDEDNSSICKADNLHCKEYNLAKEKGGRLGVGLYPTDVKVDAGEKYDTLIKQGVVEVMPRQLTILGEFSKVYDGKKSLDIGELKLNGVLEGDEVYATCDKLYFEDAWVGVNKDISVYNIELSGKDAKNYCIDNATISGKITPKQITLSGVTVNPKMYDGNNKAQFGSVGALEGVVEGDVVAIGAIEGNYKDSRAGKGKVVLIDKVTLVGKDKINYEVVGYPLVTGDINVNMLDEMLRRNEIVPSIDRTNK